MKKITMGTFASRIDAEEAINDLHRQLKIDPGEISYIYRNTAGELQEVNPIEISSRTPGEGAKTGVKVGSAIGALGGIAAFAAAIPIVGPIFAAGPILAALGITGIVGSAAAGAVTGGVVGSLVGALVNWGVDEPKAKEYNDRVMDGDVLVAAHADDNKNVADALSKHHAKNIEVYQLTV